MFVMQLQMYRAFNSMAEGSTKNSEQLRTIERKLPAGRKVRKISVFYHVTNSANETRIKQDKQLTQTRSPQDWNAGKDLKGVYFICNLSKWGLPTQSPHGDRRVRVPIQDIVTDNMHLFFAGFHVSGRNHHVQLILVKESQSAEYAVCGKSFVELDRASNSFLLLPKLSVSNPAGKSPDYHYYDYYILRSFSCWVNIFVVGDVVLPGGSSWDGVECTGRKTYKSGGGRLGKRSYREAFHDCSDDDDDYWGGRDYDDFDYDDYPSGNFFNDSFNDYDF